MTLVLAFLLLVVMAFLVLRPFLVAAPAVGTLGAPDLDMAEVETDLPPTAVPVTAGVTATQSAAPAVDVRTSVEAAIAARKAATRTHACTGCGRTVEPEDHFCRSCGVAVAEA